MSRPKPARYRLKPPNGIYTPPQTTALLLCFFNGPWPTSPATLAALEAEFPALKGLFVEVTP